HPAETDASLYASLRRSLKTELSKLTWRDPEASTVVGHDEERMGKKADIMGLMKQIESLCTLNLPYHLHELDDDVKCMAQTG
ncbi:3003_t:CDS:2, partial [Paraglomus occultum]